MSDKILGFDRETVLYAIIALLVAYILWHGCAKDISLLGGPDPLSPCEVCIRQCGPQTRSREYEMCTAACLNCPTGPCCGN